MSVSSLFFPAYGALWRVAEPLLRRNKRLAEGFAQRLAPAAWPGPLPERSVASPAGRMPEGARPRLWIQAASGGESRLVQALVPALREKIGPLEMLCTTCTRQGLDILRGIAVPADSLLLAAYFPLDRPDIMEKALERAAPDALILLETELWPGLMRAAKKGGLPLLTLNGRMTPKSRRAYGLAGPLWRGLAPQRVLAVSDADARRFASLFGASCAVSVMPNIKFDLAGAHADAARAEDAAAPRHGLPAAPGLPQRALTMLLASVREQEEDLLLPVLSALHGRTFAGMPLAPVLAPRHLHRLEAWQARLSTAGIPWRLRSGDGAGAPQGPPPVLLQDRFGELQSLYGAADAVFVGGSLARLGGQNYLEALSQGLSPFVGPFTENFAWADETFAQGLARRVPDAQALLAALKAELAECARVLAGAENPEAVRRERRQIIRNRFQAFLAPRLGGAAQAAEAAAEALRIKKTPAR